MPRFITSIITLIVMTTYCYGSNIENYPTPNEIKNAIYDPNCSMNRDEISYNILNNFAEYPPDKIPPDYYEYNHKFCHKIYCNPVNLIYNGTDRQVEFLRSLISGSAPNWYYERNIFDCSEMSAYLEHLFELCGYDAKICASSDFAGTGNAHAWVAVDIYGYDKNKSIRYFIDGTNHGTMPTIEETVSSMFLDKSLIKPSDERYKNYLNYEEIYEDIYDVCINRSINEFNWWQTLRKTLQDADPNMKHLAYAKRGIQPGLLKVYLSDGYNISFELNESGKAPYDIFIYEPRTGDGWKSYDLAIYSNKTEWSKINGIQFPSQVQLLIVDIILRIINDASHQIRQCDYPVSSPEYNPDCLIKLGVINNSYTRYETLYKEIDDSAGYLHLYWSDLSKQIRSNLTPENANYFEFCYFPGARSWEVLNSAIFVECDSRYRTDLKGILPVIYGLINSIHVEGPRVPIN
jgi:hypothetical protein